MKKITLLAVAFVAITFASCKKDRTCECTYTQTGTTNVTSNTSTTVFKKIKKSDAKYFCTKQVNTSTYTSANTTTSNGYTSDCKLK